MDNITQRAIDLEEVSIGMDASAPHGEYDRGMANGVRLALAVLKNERPEYIHAASFIGKDEEESE